MTGVHRLIITLFACGIALGVPISLAQILFREASWWTIQSILVLIAALLAAVYVIVQLRKAQHRVGMILIGWGGGSLFLPIAVLVPQNLFGITHDSALIASSVISSVIMVLPLMYIVHIGMRPEEQ